MIKENKTENQEKTEKKTTKKAVAASKKEKTVKKEKTENIKNKTKSKKSEKKPEEATVVETNSLAVLDGDDKKKVKKQPKKHIASIPRKKIPSIFKKKYSKRKLKKKLLSKIYIDEDKKFVNSFFQEFKIQKKNNKEKIYYVIPDDKFFTPVEAKKLKALSKEVKKQKGTIKFLPLFIFIGIIASVFIFTDLILSIGLKSTFQGIFKAKVEIGYIHLDYLDSSIRIKNFVVANKDAPMTNLFQFDSIVFDIDINRLISKSFVIDEIEAAGFATGTPRKTSGALEKKEKKNENKEPLIKPEFIAAMKEKISRELQKIFEKFDPNTIIEQTYNSLQTPVASEQLLKTINELLPYWQNKPEELTSEVQSFMTEVNKLSSIDFSNIKDVTKLQENINLISNTIKMGEDISSSFQGTYNKLEKDFSTVSNLTSTLEKAIQADTKLASNITSSIKSFTPDAGMKIISDTIEEFLNGVLGNIYPTTKEIIAMVQDIKEKMPEKEPKEKEEKPKVERLKGTDFTWGRPEMPKFYVGFAHASGSGFDFSANNISSNPSLINAPMTLDGTYTIASRQDSFNATLDLRDDRVNPMFQASYHAPDLETNFDFLDSKTTLDIGFIAEEDKSFSILGKANISNANITIPAFEPEFAYNICETAIDEIDTTYLGVEAGFSGDGKLLIDIDTDLDNQFMNGITNIVTEELSKIKDEATKAITAKLEEYSAPVKEKIAEFNSYKDKINDSKNQLESKIAELKAQLEEQKQKIIQDGKDKTETAIQNTLNNYVDTSKLDSLKKLF